MAGKSNKATESPLIEIARKHFAEQTRLTQASLISRLKGLLEYWNETFIREPALRKPEHRHWPFVWPRKEELSEFDELLFGLVGTIRKKAVTQEKAISLASEEWPTLQLNEFFVRMVTRFKDLQTPPPTPNLEAKRFSEILKQAKSKKGALAAEFLCQHELLLQGKPAHILWPRFRSLFCEADGSIHLNDQLPVSQDSDIEVYAKYLEVYHGFLLWREEVAAWLKAGEQKKPLLDWLEKNEQKDLQLALKPQERRRILARDRKRRERRRKKLSQKGVTRKGSGSLAHLGIS